MTPRLLANRLLEADEDFDVGGEVTRLTSTPYPGIQLEIEGSHWNVYKLKEGRQNFIGEIFYDDMSNMPREIMTPEQIAMWDAHRWTAVAGFREAETQFCVSFDEALKFILATHAAKTMPPPNLGESEDSDDPEFYVHRERYFQQPSEEEIQGALRRKLAPYYTDVRISKRPGMFAHLAAKDSDLGRPNFKDSFIWTVHCNRDTPLPLSIAKRNLPGYEIDWRDEVKHWFEKWATHAGLALLKFEIYGRLRKDPTFQFETARLGPLTLKEDEEDDLSPEEYVADFVDKYDSSRQLLDALWKWHPYGVNYNAMLGYRGGFVVAVIYFPPEKDDFYKRFVEFVVSWIKERKLFTVNTTKLTGGQYVDSSYPTWGLMLALNSDLPKDTPPYAPPVAHQ